MPLSPLEQLRRVQEVRELWAELSGVDDGKGSSPIEGVREQEAPTIIRPVGSPHPPQDNRGYQAHFGLDGFNAWLKAFQLLQPGLTEDENRDLDKISAILLDLRNDKKLNDNKIIEKKIKQLHEEGATYLLGGHQNHMNIVCISGGKVPPYTHTLYDAGYEATSLGSYIDFDGHEREKVAEIESRKVNDDVVIAELIRDELKKKRTAAGGPSYDTAKAHIAAQLSKEATWYEEGFAQRRSNCVTRGQRLLVRQIAGDHISDLLYHFVTQNESHVKDIEKQLSDLEFNCIEELAEPTIPQGEWQPYHSIQFGPCQRYSAPFTFVEATTTLTMQAFERQMREQGIHIQWGRREGSMYACVPESDRISTANLLDPIKTPLPEGDWLEYKGADGKELYNYSQPFPRVHRNDVSTAMQAFADRMQKYDIAIEWLWYHGKAYAYVPMADRESIDNLIMNNNFKNVWDRPNPEVAREIRASYGVEGNRITKIHSRVDRKYRLEFKGEHDTAYMSKFLCVPEDKLFVRAADGVTTITLTEEDLTKGRRAARASTVHLGYNGKLGETRLGFSTPSEPEERVDGPWFEGASAPTAPVLAK